MVQQHDIHDALFTYNSNEEVSLQFSHKTAKMAFHTAKEWMTKELGSGKNYLMQFFN